MSPTRDALHSRGRGPSPFGGDRNREGWRGPLPRLEAEKTRPEREPNHAPPGQFISDEHEADCSRFLEEVKEFVRRRHEAGLGRDRY